MLADFAPELEYKDGELRVTTRNLARLQILEKVMAEFAGDEAKALIERFAVDLLEVAGRNESYYLLAGFEDAKVKAITEDTALIRARIGLDEKGRILKGGYLDRSDFETLGGRGIRQLQPIAGNFKPPHGERTGVELFCVHRGRNR